MNKIHCNVVQDLMPSYIDNLCSKESEILVEEHLKECQACQKYKHRICAQDIQLDLGSREELDYMKKTRRNMDLKNAFFFLIIVGISIGFIVYLQKNYYPMVFLILLPVLLICNCFTAFKQESIGKLVSKKIVFAYIMNLFIVLYMPFLMLILSNKWITSANYPFGLQEYQIGPFIYYQLLSIMIVEIMFWIGTIVINIKTSSLYMGLSAMSIIGFWLALYYTQLIKSLGSVSEYFRMSSVSLGILAEGVIIMGIVWTVKKFNRGRKRKMDSIKNTIEWGDK